MRYLAFVSMVIVAWGCSSKKGPSKEEFVENLEDVGTSLGISDENITNIINSIPSPLEISFLIKDEGIRYDNTLLNNADNVSRYNSNYRKALNLGIYGTDLGYTDIYEQSQDGLEYLVAIRDIANDLGIGQFFDFDLIRSLTESSQNLDSLLLVTSNNFNRINEHFQEQNRSELSVMLLLGGWIESLHLTCEVTMGNMHIPALKERVGEQKILIENMLILLDVYSGNSTYVNGLTEAMKELQSAYEDVEITYTYEESTSKIVDGILVIEDNSTSQVDIDDEKIIEIARLTNKIRSIIID